jgi:hypothetical protein
MSESLWRHGTILKNASDMPRLTLGQQAELMEIWQKEGLTEFPYHTDNATLGNAIRMMQVMELRYRHERGLLGE